MGRPRNPNNPSCPYCGSERTVGHGAENGVQRGRCQTCPRTFAATVGTPLHRLKTPPDEIIQAIRIVLRRGSLRAAEDLTGHKYETIGHWLRLVAAHAEAVTARLVHNRELSEVEVDELWSFVHHKLEKGAFPQTTALLPPSLRPPRPRWLNRAGSAGGV